MSATIISLKRWSKTTLSNIRSSEVEKMFTADPESGFLDGARVRLLLDDLRARQDTLLSVIDNLRAPSLRAHPKFGRPAADLEATSIQALAEVKLLIQHGAAVLHRHEKAAV